MRGVSTWAVAVRRPLPEQVAAGKPLDPGEAARGAIEIQSFPLTSVVQRASTPKPLVRSLRLPVVRGVVALVESLRIGIRALGISANAQLPDDHEPISGPMWVGTIVLALAIGIGLFFVVPVGVTSLFKDQLGSAFLFWLVEGLLRTAIFLGYVWAISNMAHLRRVFQFHGAEHKTISCYEAGLPLTPENAQHFSRLHPRCGTSFLLVVMIVAIFVFAPIGLPSWWILLASRIIGVPLIAGISFEIVKFAGRNRARRWVRGVMWPGLQLQKLTTREPDASQLAVAIAALEAVLAVETPGEQPAEELAGVEIMA